MANTDSRIPVLWFDRRGNGPDELALELHNFPSDLEGRIPAYLGIRVRAGEIVIGAGPLVDGGFNLHRDQVADLHRQLGAWLEANPTTAPTATDGSSAKWRRVVVGNTDITEHVAAMFDVLVASLDWGSDFLAAEDVVSIVLVADLVGFDIPVDRGPVSHGRAARRVARADRRQGSGTSDRGRSPRASPGA